MLTLTIIPLNSSQNWLTALLISISKNNGGVQRRKIKKKNPTPWNLSHRISSKRPNSSLQEQSGRQTGESYRRGRNRHRSPLWPSGESSSGKMRNQNSVLQFFASRYNFTTQSSKETHYRTTHSWLISIQLKINFTSPYAVHPSCQSSWVQLAHWTYTILLFEVKSHAFSTSPVPAAGTHWHCQTLPVPQKAGAAPRLQPEGTTRECADRRACSTLDDK